MILLLSYFFVRKTIGFSDPSTATTCPSSFLAPLHAVATKAITEPRLAS